MKIKEPLREEAIKYWPRHERPRERLLKHGPQSLSDAELLAIFLRTGVSGRSAVDLARALLQRFQGLRGLFAADYRELRAIKGLGDAKIATLLATIELSKRYLREQLEQRRAIRNPEDVYQLLAHSMRDLDHEVFTVFFLTSKNEILAIEELFRGTINTSAVHPREVVKRALQHGAAALICAHNHPSGNPEPSPQDRMLTRELKEACRLMEIALLDHLVIGHNRYWSFAEHGEL
jgi:DNA repair protein RadC